MPVQTNENICQIGCSLATGKQEPRMSVPTPADCDKSTKRSTINIFQANMSGLQNKTTELTKVLHDNQVHIALLQETILPDREISIPKNFVSYKCECDKCQGIMTLIRTDVQATVRNTPIEDVDIQEIEVWMGNEKFQVYNFYCPSLI